MKLENKKSFISKVLGVGKGRIILNTQRLAEVKESMTRQDVRDLVASGAILIRDPLGRKVIEKRKRRRQMGSIKMRPVNKKREYMIITRKLRSYLAHLKIQGKISAENYVLLRKKIRARAFSSLTNMKESAKDILGGKQ